MGVQNGAGAQGGAANGGAGDVGARLRALREDAGMSLRALARELGITPSAVSQIETGRLRPSIGRLIAITEALGVPLAAAFGAAGEAADDGGNLAVARAADSPATVLGTGVTFRRLSPRPVDELDFFESVYPPGAVSSAGEMVRHEGYEIGTVTSGELTVELDTETVVLGPGDSITFPCSRPHLIANRSADVPAVATWLIVHV